jgi:hypothetical protein
MVGEHWGLHCPFDTHKRNHVRDHGTQNGIYFWYIYVLFSPTLRVWNKYVTGGPAR